MVYDINELCLDMIEEFSIGPHKTNTCSIGPHICFEDDAPTSTLSLELSMVWQWWPTNAHALFALHAIVLPSPETKSSLLG